MFVLSPSVYLLNKIGQADILDQIWHKVLQICDLYVKIYWLEVDMLPHDKNVCVCVCVYICGAFNKFPDFFVQAFKIVIDSWKFTMLLLYIL